MSDIQPFRVFAVIFSSLQYVNLNYTITIEIEETIAINIFQSSIMEDLELILYPIYPCLFINLQSISSVSLLIHRMFYLPLLLNFRLLSA